LSDRERARSSETVLYFLFDIKTGKYSSNPIDGFVNQSDLQMTNTLCLLSYNLP